MKKDSTNQQVKKFPVREGTAQSAVTNEKPSVENDKYPKPTAKDNQVKNQPEFTEEQPNRKSPSSPANSKK